MLGPAKQIKSSSQGWRELKADCHNYPHARLVDWGFAGGHHPAERP
jgi:hypothetical protein